LIRLEHCTYSVTACCVFAMADYCIALPVTIEDKGSGESPFALIPSWRYKQNIARSSISECSVGGGPDRNRTDGQSSLTVVGFRRNQRVVCFTKAEKRLVAVLCSMSS
jgi:hypothetical protein